MAVWSVVNFSQVIETLRFDADYYQPKFLSYEKEAGIKGGLLSNYISDIIQPAEFIREYVDKGEGAAFWRAQNIRPGYINTEDVEYISWATFSKVPNAHVKEGDILITRTGANAGDCAVVPEISESIAVSSHTLRLIPKTVELGYAIGTFFSSNLGRDILFRTVSGSSRPQITKEILLSIRVPDFSAIEAKITEIIKLFNQKREQSTAFYAEAEVLLLHELGLDTLDFSTQKTYIANFSETVEGERFDAEYFQPKYYRVLDALKSLKIKRLLPLGFLLESITNGQTPLHHDLSEGDITFLTAEHILDFRINYDSDKRVLKEHHEQKLQKTQLREKDVLITIKGRIGNAAVVENLSKPVNINQDVALLRLRGEYHPYYIAGFINSLAGKALTEQIGTGQINPFLGLGNLQKLMIPIFEQSYMDKIGGKVEQKVHEACQAQKEADQLLEQAKLRVEQMILGEHATDEYPS